jgi:hypothetical protein
MYIPKKYGQSKVENCPFCGKIGTTKNKQGLAVCTSHKDETLQDVKCVCGEWLEPREGKWGAYFHCLNCGNINLKKALEGSLQLSSAIKQNKKEITVRSDKLDFLY